MKVEITNNVSGTGAETLDYSIGHPIKAVCGHTRFSKLSSIVLLSENLEGHRVAPGVSSDFENDNVTLPMSLFLLAQ